MLRAKGESGQASPGRMRWILALLAVGLIVVVAYFVIGPKALRPITEEPDAPRGPSGVAPLPALEPGGVTLADVASIEDDFSRNAALYALIGDAPRMRVEEWLAQVDTLPATLHRSDVARVLYIRFTVLDPEAALRHALRGETRASWLAAIFRTWGQLDPEAAAARAGTLLPSAKAAASRALLELDLPLAELRTMVARLDETGPVSNVQRQAQLMTGAPQLSRSAYLLAEIEARSHARRDGESHADAWERAISFEGEALVRQILVDRIVIDWAMQDPAAAMAAVESWTTDDEYQPFVTGGGFAPSMPMATFLKSRVMVQWSQDDARAALAWAMARDPADVQRFVPVVLSVLAERSPGEAIARLRDLPEPLRRRAAGGVLWALARTDLDRALRFFETLSVEQQSQNTMALSQELVSERSPQEAVDWALSLDRRIRPREVAAVLRRLYSRDHAETLRLFDAIEDPAIRTAAASGLVAQQVQRDAREALAWARDFRPETEREKLVVQVFDAWSRTDPGRACRALLETRGGPTRDRAAAAMMASVVGHDPNLAERLFDSIETPEQQGATAQILYRYFTEVDSRQRKAERYRKFLPAEDDDAADEEEDS